MGNKQQIIELLRAKSSGAKGWYLCTCVFCGKKDHMGIILNEQGIGSFNCWKCKKHGSIYQVLEKLGRLDLWDFDQTILLNESIKSELLIPDFVLDLSLVEKALPIGYKRIFSHSYLENRDFTLQQFSIFEVGITNVHPVLKKDYVIFVVRDEGVCVGYIARSTKSKEEITRINVIRESKGLKKYLRYINSSSDFSKILFGYDEVIFGVTKTVILVEGITDKFNVDRLLNLYNKNILKCNSTNGNKISVEQIEKLRRKGVENVILLYDFDAIKQSKFCSMELDNFFNTKVGTIHGDKDPGDLNLDELTKILNSLQSPISFFSSKISKSSLI